MSNEMKLIMESWRRNVLLEQQADEFQQITVEQFLQKFGKAATSGKRFMNKLLDFVKEYAGKVDELLADDPNGSKVGNWFKALARSAKNYALGKSLELAGMALGGTIGAIISGGATLGAGAVPGAAVGAKVGEEMAKFLKEALTEFWNKGLQEADEAMRKLFLTFQVQDNSSTDPIVKAFDLKDGYSYLLRATNKPKGGEDSEFFKAVFMNFLNQMINLYDDIQQELQTKTTPQEIQDYNDKKLSEIAPSLKTSDEIAKQYLDGVTGLDIKPPSSTP